IGVEAYSHAPGAASAASSAPAASRARAAFLRPLAPIAATAAALAFVMLALGQRPLVAALVPAAAKVYAAIGLPVAAPALSIVDVHGRLVDGADGRPTLAVTGRIVNSGTRASPAPKVAVKVLGAGGEPLYAWDATASAREVAAGGDADFRVSLAVPPAGASSVAVTIADAGTR
ncbi:MAG: DUF3426 domain-containing protein, partial [Hyphomicrobiales bacterium]|nr:DUF3426 domain-containing protein [Hyphomicrobiales bacterium]